MSERGGIYTWERQPMLDAGGYLPAVWLDGRIYDSWVEVEAGGISWRDEDGVVVLETHAGTHIVQVPYRGAAAPLVGNRKEFTTGLTADSLADYRHLEATRALGRPVYFCPGLWATDAFPASAGSSYTLTRPLAAGIVPGVSGVTHPVFVELDGVEDPSAADVAGQIVTANATGTLVVHYLAVFRVVILGFERSISDGNTLSIQLTLSECVEGNF